MNTHTDNPLRLVNANINPGLRMSPATTGDKLDFDRRLEAAMSDEDRLRTTAEELVATGLIKPMFDMMKNDPFKTDMFHGGFGEDAFADQLHRVFRERMVTSTRDVVAMPLNPGDDTSPIARIAPADRHDADSPVHSSHVRGNSPFPLVDAIVDRLMQQASAMRTHKQLRDEAAANMKRDIQPDIAGKLDQHG